MISSAYSYYLSQYGNRETSRYDNTTRRPSDVRRAYSRLLKINRFTPDYKNDMSIDAQKYAIDLKENARELSNIANDLSGSDSSSLVIKQAAESSDSDVIDVRYVGKGITSANSFDVMVNQLALPQINTGNYLPPNSKYLTPGEYSFDLNISGITYEFEFGINDNDTSRSVQEKISRLINRSNIGLSSQVLSDDMGNTALSVTSDDTGVTGLKASIFDIQENVPDGSSRPASVDVLGLNRVSQYPSNAVYSIDGNDKTSASNRVTINNTFELTFHKVSQSPVSISLKADGDAVVDSINELIGGYNNLISAATKATTFDGTSRLHRQFLSLSRSYGSMLKASGLDVRDDGSIEVNAEAIREMAASDSLDSIFESLGRFKNALQDTADRIAMNPMDYVNNKIIAYKNPQRATTSPYYPSAYTGMMFNGYI